MAKVAVEFLKNKGKLGSIYIRFTHKQKRVRVALDIQIKEKDWNPVKGEVRQSSEDFYVHNQVIADALALANRVLADRKLSGSLYTADDLAADFRVRFRPTGRTNGASPAPVSFTEFAKDRVALMHREKRYGTHDQYRTTFDKVHEFHKSRTGSDRIEFADITRRFLEEFQAYWIQQDNMQSTIRNNLSKLRHLIKESIEAGHMSPTDDPFRKVKLPPDNRNKPYVYLTDTELEKLRSLRLKPGSGKWHIRNVFLFSVYSQGLRIGDALRLKWGAVTDRRLSYVMGKTGKTKSVLIVGKSQAILDEYLPRKTGPDRHIFPLLDAFRPASLNEEDFYKLIQKRSAYSNNELRIMARRAGIQKNLSTHVARHTFSNLALENGWSIQQLSRALGHSSLATTEKYVRQLRDEDLDEKALALFD